MQTIFWLALGAAVLWLVFRTPSWVLQTKYDRWRREADQRLHEQENARWERDRAEMAAKQEDK
jgi:hypothetical protein